MAAFLLIGTVTTIVPEINYGTGDNPGERVRTQMDVLDRTGELSGNPSTAEIKNDIQEQVTSDFNYSVTKLETNSETKSFDLSSGEAEKSFNVDGDDFELQIFVESAGNLNVSYNGDMKLKQETEEGYYLRPATGGNNDVQVNGTGTVDVVLRGYGYEDGDRPFDTVSSVKYVKAENQTMQIGVFIWEPDRP
jgi:hypothetical protein